MRLSKPKRYTKNEEGELQKWETFFGRPGKSVEIAVGVVRIIRILHSEHNHEPWGVVTVVHPKL